jgi:hypothetical protein
MSAGSTASVESASARPARASQRIPRKKRAGPSSERRNGERRKIEPIPTTVASRPDPDADAADRDHLLERLENLRTIVPVFAHELASARRQTAALRFENSRLLERIRELQRKHARPT